ncbi:hypothetical protein [Mycobacterium sp. NPDC006124]|uniref:hypothetical protein n=1 Tax=Mycobacterium sp. NPDC006124 TaxID=3156729 RepID=UPI0033A59D41
MRSSSLSVGAGVTAVGAVALLISQYGAIAATPEQPAVPEIRTAALPFEFDFNRTFPWAVAPGNVVSSVGSATVSAVSAYSNAVLFGAGAALQTANQIGPLTYGLNSIKAISAQQGPNGVQPSSVNVTDLDQWQVGLAGLANTAGAIGFVDNAAYYDPYIATHAGFLQTTNNLGPAFFNLNVLKAIGLTQAPNASSGNVLASGRPDDWSAVDIGRWSAGIPGVITNTGTTGFVFSLDFGNGLDAFFVGGLHTTTTIGGMVFDFNFLPSIRAGLYPPSLSVSLAPDMTAAETEFRDITPPPPGTIDPPVTNPLPFTPPTTLTARSAPATETISGPPPADAKAAAEDEAPADPTVVADEPKVDATKVSEPTEVSEPKPKVEIPGVNGVPLTATPGTGAGTSSGGGNGPADPFAGLRSFADSVRGGIERFTGTGPAPAAGTGGSGSESAGGASGSTGGAGAGSAGSSGGSDK